MNYYYEIKNELINNEINRKVKNYSINKSDLNSYYNVGKILNEAGKHYGEGIIKEYSKKLTNDLNIKYDVSTLNKMRKFYNLIEKMATLSPNLSCSHYVELLPYDDLNKVKNTVSNMSFTDSNDLNNSLDNSDSSKINTCPTCGVEIHEGYAFCDSCGTKL